MTTIRIADVHHPRPDDDEILSSPNESVFKHHPLPLTNIPDDNIYNIRDTQHPSFLTRRSVGQDAAVSQEDDDPGLRRPGDFDKKQV